jgi:Tfp pilus assembly protein PilO
MKNKNIELKDITSSPYFVAVLMVLLIGLCIAALVFFVLDIQETKNEIKDARALYEANVKEYAVLEQLKAKSEVAEKQLEECKGILPDSLGDVYILQEDVVEKCGNFGLTVSNIEYAVATNETQEVVFTINANGTFSNIYNFMNYYTNLEQQHRFDSIVLNKDASTGNYNTVLTLVILSEQGVSGMVNSPDAAA